MNRDVHRARGGIADFLGIGRRAGTMHVRADHKQMILTALIVALLAMLCGVAQAAGVNPNIVVIQGLEGVKRVDFSRPIPDAPIHRGSGGNNYDRPELRPFAVPDTAPGAPDGPRRIPRGT